MGRGLASGRQGRAGQRIVGDTIVSDSTNTLVHATSRLVSVVGLNNVVVVETPDAVLVADRARSQEVKSIVGQLHARQRDEHVVHRQRASAMGLVRQHR